MVPTLMVMLIVTYYFQKYSASLRVLHFCYIFCAFVEQKLMGKCDVAFCLDLIVFTHASEIGFGMGSCVG
jgi:hypothetical protein